MVSLRLENDDDVDISPAWLTAHAPWPWWGERWSLAGRGDSAPAEGHGGRLGTLVETDVKTMIERDLLFQIKHQRAQAAWRNFADNMGKDNIRSG